jgi:hypothetical protein
MMYLDYKAAEITKEGRENLINMISKQYNIKREILIKYSEIYGDYPFITLSDTLTRDAEITIERLNIITRSFKLNKIISKIE